MAATSPSLRGHVRFLPLPNPARPPLHSTRKLWPHGTAAHACDATRFDLSSMTEVACYAGGGTGYKRHQDVSAITKPWSTKPKGFSNWRVFTAILYANPGWKERDGGCLQIFPAQRRKTPVAFGSRADDSNDARPESIAPLAGRVLLFDSLLEHEVCPSFCDRYAVTLWIWREVSGALLSLADAHILSQSRALMRIMWSRTRASTGIGTALPHSSMSIMDSVGHRPGYCRSWLLPRTAQMRFCA